MKTNPAYNIIVPRETKLVMKRKSVLRHPVKRAQVKTLLLKKVSLDNN